MFQYFFQSSFAQYGLLKKFDLSAAKIQAAPTWLFKPIFGEKESKNFWFSYFSCILAAETVERLALFHSHNRFFQKPIYLNFKATKHIGVSSLINSNRMYDILQLNDMLLPELLDVADGLHIENAKKLDKQELIYKILDRQAVAGNG